MPRITTLERSFGQMLNPSASLTTCRSCRSLVINASQRHRFQTSASQEAGLGLTNKIKGVFGKKKKTKKVENVEEVKRSTANGWQLPREKNMPKTWAKTPQQDPKYVVSDTGNNLEHVGSAKWIEKQFDAQGDYEGWSRLKKATGLPPQDAKMRVLEAAKLAGLEQAQLEEQGLGSVVNDMRTKFKIVRALRQSTKIQIPDITMQRAETLKDFQKAVLFKPKPKKLSMELLSNEELLQNANLTVRAHRQTPIHKDKAVGRWKLIEAELANRGLPITGHGIKAQRGFEAESQEIPESQETQSV